MDDAIKAARTAFEGWSKTSGHTRARYLYAIARGLQKHHRLMAVLESMDNGKTVRETRDADVQLVIRHFYHHAGWAQLADTEMSEYAPRSRTSTTRARPAVEPHHDRGLHPVRHRTHVAQLIPRAPSRQHLGRRRIRGRTGAVHRR